MDEKIDIIEFDEFDDTKKDDDIKLEITYENEKPKIKSIDEVDFFIKQQEEIRNNLLDETEKKLSENNKIMNEYNQLLKEHENIKKEYIKLYKVYKKNLNSIKDSQEDKLREEVVSLKTKNIKLNRKLKMVQTLLQQIIDEYSIYDICEITRLTEEKIKEYLE